LLIILCHLTFLFEGEREGQREKWKEGEG
jgi:hypothetical protein